MNVGDFPLTTLLDVATAAREPASHEVARDAAAACIVVWYGQDCRAHSDDARVLIFTSSPLSLELEVMAGHVVGQIVPPGPGEILVERTTGPPSRSRRTTSASSTSRAGRAARSACDATLRRGG